jgi:16S rRNA (uracil1498-N3)-methyltransferase
MKIHRFFVEQSLPKEGTVKIEHDDLVHQWRNVLRFQVGQEVILYDNSGAEFHGLITQLTNRVAEVEIQSVAPRNFSPKRAVSLFLALPKRDSFEWTLEKGTELGVAAFVPVVSERSEKKDINLARSKNLLKEACEQSGRSVLPQISEPVPLAKALENLATESIHTIALDPTGEAFNIAQLPLSTTSVPVPVNIFIGPEGGFSPAELELFKAHKISVHSFSTQVLRAETAAVAIASVLLLDF